MCQWCIQAYSTESTRSSNYCMDHLTKGIFHVHLKDSARWRWFLQSWYWQWQWGCPGGFQISPKPWYFTLTKLAVDLVTWNENKIWDFLFETLPQVWQYLSNRWCFLVVKFKFGMICKEISISWYLLEIHTQGSICTCLCLFITKTNLEFTQFFVFC